MSSATGLRGQTRCLLLALICSCTCLQGTDSASHLQPYISSHLRYQPDCGETIRILCEGYTAFADSGIMYWLANGTFLEDLYSEEEVTESSTIEEAKGTGLALRRELFIPVFTKKILSTKFECIVLDPAGSARKAVTWKRNKELHGQDAAVSGSGVLGNF
ncbi:interleukin-18-binding protein [Rhineura floridana]|uniref:interleukin-18-binding protein n=1 Tax=Rhineura floridana TaxID=261503 RepID=UPI002AC82E63|nr:interleukin-18-binding protein [Rhineura floridana]XP_061485642.1 interleukin-18-binding protein [Rhineura floridana]